MTSLEEARRHKADRARALDSALASAVGYLRGLGALRVILFGSVARGELDLGSDLDLLVVMPDTRSGREWIRLINAEIPRNAAIDLLVYAESELAREIPRNSFLRDIQERGRVVYEKALQ